MKHDSIKTMALSRDLQLLTETNVENPNLDDIIRRTMATFRVDETLPANTVYSVSSIQQLSSDLRHYPNLMSGVEYLFWDARHFSGISASDIDMSPMEVLRLVTVICSKGDTQLLSSFVLESVEVLKEILKAVHPVQLAMLMDDADIEWDSGYKITTGPIPATWWLWWKEMRVIPDKIASHPTSDLRNHPFIGNVVVDPDEPENSWVAAVATESRLFCGPLYMIQFADYRPEPASTSMTESALTRYAENVYCSSGSQFTLFPLLPPELREQIFRFAFCSPRVAQIDADRWFVDEQDFWYYVDRSPLNRINKEFWRYYAQIKSSLPTCFGFESDILHLNNMAFTTLRGMLMRPPYFEYITFLAINRGTLVKSSAYPKTLRDFFPRLRCLIILINDEQQVSKQVNKEKRLWERDPLAMELEVMEGRAEYSANPPTFENAEVEIFGSNDQTDLETITGPFKAVTKNIPYQQYIQSDIKTHLSKEARYRGRGDEYQKFQPTIVVMSKSTGNLSNSSF